MKITKYCMLFVGLIAIVIGSGSATHAIAPYEIDKDYWFFDLHTIKTNDGWTFQIKELEKYNISGKVGGIKYYQENYLPFSPVDFCMGRGKVVEPPHDKWGNFSMGHRKCDHTYQAQDYRIALSEEYIDAHISNSHLIPSNKKVFDRLMDIKEGDFIEIAGSLVRVTGENKNGTYIPPWTSDTKGTFKKCEIILVKDIKVVEVVEKSQKNSNFLERITMLTIMFILLIILISRRK